MHTKFTSNAIIFNHFTATTAHYIGFYITMTVIWAEEDSTYEQNIN